MNRYKLICIGLLIFLSNIFINSVFAQENNTLEQKYLKQECIKATIVAIDLELARYKNWLSTSEKQGNEKQVLNFQQRIAELQMERQRYLDMNVEEYILPKKELVTTKFEAPIGIDSILYLKEMSKHGPWYHIAGMENLDLSFVQENSHYQVGFYNIYPRNYWGMNSAYIYISDVSSSLENRQISGEVFTPKNFVNLKENLVPVNNYKVYLLKEMNADGAKLVLSANKSKFSIQLSAEDLATYKYIEFVAEHRSKVISLANLPDENLEIILEPEMMVKKPAIYLYPEKSEQIIIKHTFKGKILNTYPKYKYSWQVIAQPNGILLNLEDQRSYRYLFWDGKYSFFEQHYKYKDGFYIKRADYIDFLQEKLLQIGLNQQEINDFIVYWLPALNNYEQCFIHFRINDDIDGSSLLETIPKADTVLRLFMEFRGIALADNITKLPEQELPTILRQGFTLVEWGGAEIGSEQLQ